MSNNQNYDAIIFGGGHNGLTCGYYLGKAGLKVKILERRGIVGGAAITEEFHPGYRNSVASYSVSLLNPKVIEDMSLARHGMVLKIRPTPYFQPHSDTSYLIIDRDPEITAEQIGKFSQKDAKAYPVFHERLEKVCEFLRGMLLKTPPNHGGGWRDLLAAAGAANHVRKTGNQTQKDIYDLFTMSAGDLLDQWFESNELKGILGFDAVIGNYASPYTPGSAYVLLHHVFGEVNGVKGAWGYAMGGMGAITQAMAKACEEVNVDIEVDAAVKEVIVNNGATVGVEMEDGTELYAPKIISNLNPKLLYTKLIASEHLSEDFNRRISGWVCASGTFRMNVALTELPDFTCLPGKEVSKHHSSSIIICPTMKYLDDAYLDARCDGWAKKPAIEMHIPSVVDDSLAPPGHHVASLFCQQFAPEIPDGRSWDDCKEEVADLIIDTINNYAPNFKQSIAGRMSLSPLDLERKIGLIGGDIFHGSLNLNQMYSARPALGYGDYRGPLKGLYMCGSGTHPGGGVTGIPGHNAAREILRD
ncbi:MAG: NAD(P)/FAD-dependent oxidoreductase [Kordiimonadaceae bacterium]|jgi:phytoene dehydrogenase-like protein|nr:NAD(P)/FAD-dependent oxidoreductase [Kordiimonadaceae bacterium]